MYDHANTGVIIILASDLVDTSSAWTKHNPGKVLNWARTKYDRVMLDHSSFMNSFILVIYKHK